MYHIRIYIVYIGRVVGYIFDLAILLPIGNNCGILRKTKSDKL